MFGSEGLPRSLMIVGLAGAVMFAGVPPSASQVQFGASSKRTRPALPAMGPSLRSVVSFSTTEPVGSIVIRKSEKALYLVSRPGEALRYQISVGRDGFGWEGTVRIGAKKEWPEWRPPAEMRQRQPELPDFVPSGPYNPLGARALYLHEGGRDTLYRIHGTNDPAGVGFDGTSGCFRLTNTDIVDLFRRVSIGAKVVVE